VTATHSIPRRLNHKCRRQGNSNLGRIDGATRKLNNNPRTRKTVGVARIGSVGTNFTRRRRFEARLQITQRFAASAYSSQNQILRLACADLATGSVASSEDGDAKDWDRQRPCKVSKRWLYSSAFGVRVEPRGLSAKYPLQTPFTQTNIYHSTPASIGICAISAP